MILIVEFVLTRKCRKKTRVGLDEKAGIGEGQLWLRQQLLTNHSRLFLICLFLVSHVNSLHLQSNYHYFSLLPPLFTYFFGNDLDRCKRSKSWTYHHVIIRVKSFELCPGLNIVLSLTTKNVQTFIK